jgi:hypothetical protein
MSEPKTLVDAFYSRIRNNPVAASLIILGAIVIGLSSFTDAAKNLLDLVITDTRPEINGEWKAEVTYDWTSRTFTETFTIQGDGDEVYGTASFLGVKRGIVEGKDKSRGTAVHDDNSRGVGFPINKRTQTRLPGQTIER